MKPARVFSFLLLIWTGLLLIAWFFPPEGLYLRGNLRLKFPGLRAYREVLKKTHSSGRESRKDILLPGEHPLQEDSLLYFPADSAAGPPADDTLSLASLSIDTARDWSPAALRVNVPDFVCPPGCDSLLFTFFRLLDAARGGDGPVHVLHYGDSQIEGDRISSYLREKWQGQFGGGGTGALPATLVVDETVSFAQFRSGNWERTTFPELTDSPAARRRLGFLMSSGSFLPGKEGGEGWMRIEWYARARQGIKNYKRAGLVYGQAPDSFRLTFLTGGEERYSELLPPSRSPGRVSFTVREPLNTQVEFHINSGVSPEVYAFFLEGDEGVVVHNIPVRGSAGLEFSRVNTGILKGSLQEMRTGLVILQYGINLVPGWKGQTGWYLGRLTSELRFLRSLFPGVPVLVIGVSDMLSPGTGGPEPYPGITDIRAAQKEAALSAGCMFWDACEAMGGEGSVDEWVKNLPPLARTDYTHFTYAGSQLFAGLLYKAFEKEYLRYREYSGAAGMAGEKNDTTGYIQGK